jgi:hypothetical protein
MYKLWRNVLLLKMKYKELPDGWITPIHKNFKAICCDCSLVHDMDFRICKGKIQFKVRRNNYSTALTRRNKTK